MKNGKGLCTNYWGGEEGRTLCLSLFKEEKKSKAHPCVIIIGTLISEINLTVLNGKILALITKHV